MAYLSNWEPAKSAESCGTGAIWTTKVWPHNPRPRGTALVSHSKPNWILNVSVMLIMYPHVSTPIRMWHGFNPYSKEKDEVFPLTNTWMYQRSELVLVSELSVTAVQRFGMIYLTIVVLWNLWILLNKGFKHTFLNLRIWNVDFKTSLSIHTGIVLVRVIKRLLLFHIFLLCRICIIYLNLNLPF